MSMFLRLPSSIHWLFDSLGSPLHPQTVDIFFLVFHRPDLFPLATWSPTSTWTLMRRHGRERRPRRRSCGSDKNTARKRGLPALCSQVGSCLGFGIWGLGFFRVGAWCCLVLFVRGRLGFGFISGFGICFFNPSDFYVCLARHELMLRISRSVWRLGLFTVWELLGIWGLGLF